MNVSCANYLVTVFENGNKRIDTHIASSKYIFDGIISAATYEVHVVCKENSTRLKLNSSPDTLKGTISAFPSSATLLVFIYFHIIIQLICHIEIFIKTGFILILSVDVQFHV